MPALTIARIGVALAALVESLETGQALAQLAEPSIVRIPLAGVPYLSQAWVPIFIGFWIVAALALAAGSGAAGVLLAGCMAYVTGLDQQTYSNHLYLMSVVALLVGVATLFPRHRETIAETLRAQLSIVYAFAALSKLNPAFLSGVIIAGSLRPEFEVLRTPWVLVPMALAGIATEIAVAVGLQSMTWRRVAAVAGVALHAGFIALMTNTLALTVFGVACVSLYPLFFAPREGPRS